MKGIDEGVDAAGRPEETTPRATGRRAVVRGKFLFVGDQKFYVRGVTYGTFRPRDEGCEFLPEVVEADFAAMAAHGINAVRTYTVPPRWVLERPPPTACG